MKGFAHCCSVLSLVALFMAGSSWAKPKDKAPKEPRKPAHVLFSLIPATTLPEIATAKGKFDYKSKKHTSLKGSLELPLASPSLGISDAVTAAAAQIHLEFTRDAAIYADCTLSFQAADADELEPATSARYRLHVKTNGKKEVKGTCGTNTLPAVQTGDKVAAYAIVNGTRVDFMGN